MYAHPHHMNLAKPIAGDEDGSGNSAGDSMDNSPHIRYENPALDDSATAGAGMGGMIEDIPPDAVYVPGTGGEMGMAGGEEASQLTLSFRGQVYVFDAVTPKKVLICCGGLVM